MYKIIVEVEGDPIMNTLTRDIARLCDQKRYEILEINYESCIIKINQKLRAWPRKNEKGE